MRRGGFTLLEVIVAVAVTALLVVGVYGATVGLARTGEGRRKEAAREERRARAVELLGQDWRGRVRLIVPAERPPAGATMLALSTTADAVGAETRSGADVRWIASDIGLVRSEGGRSVAILVEPVTLEAWTGQAWTREIRGIAKALRLTFEAPAERVLISR